ncbi:hypothetical protein EG329_002500 [Mollisiaceae sp. DMI_Dod_QoI]|nr:hypothetical protein EG329_002500 [Helotiales sp. DMI_Dod_QoI]
MAFYQPLDVARNEVRMLKIVDSIDGNHQDLVHCELETVSLDSFTPEFKMFSEKHDISSMESHHEITKAWLKECSPTIKRVMDDTEESDYIQLDWVKDTIVAITSDSSRCPPLPKAPPSDLREVSLYSGPIPGKDTYFLHVPRFEWGDFEAISYCWGSDKLERHIIVNKTLVDIPRNLEALLQRVKEIPEMKTGMKFWVDALCIDQRNVEEKNHQVKLMKDIYIKAFAVIVWLGDAADDSDKAVDFISTSILWALGDEIAWQEWWSRHFEGDPPNHEGIGSEMPWKALLQLFFRDYWRRLWIIQELALNRNMSLFLCGQRQLSRNMILRMCRSSVKDVEMIDTLIANKDILWKYLDDILTCRELARNAWQKSPQSNSGLGRKANVKDSKDRVYGLLGLLPSSIANQIRPNYDLSQRQVYTQFARAMLSESNSIESLLSWCAFKDDSVCPSWVPDWTAPFTRNHVQWLRERHASGSASAQWSISEDSQHLRVRGIIVDTVKSTSKSQSECLPYKSEIMELVQNDGRSFPLEHHRYGSKQNLSAALRRTLAQDHPYLHSDPAGPSILDIYWINWSYIRELDPAHDQLSHLWHAMRNITTNSSWETFDQFRHTNAEFSIFGHRFRDFFPHMRRCTDALSSASNPSFELPMLRSRPDGMIQDIELSEEVCNNMKLSMLTLFGRKLVTTAKGYLGLTPEEVREGDLIAIIYGCNFPVVLRQDHGFYCLIGECYIDGIMDGEIIEKETKVSGEHCGIELVLG